jgi:hypothetical protein
MVVHEFKTERSSPQRSAYIPAQKMQPEATAGRERDKHQHQALPIHRSG